MPVVASALTPNRLLYLTLLKLPVSNLACAYTISGNLILMDSIYSFSASSVKTFLSFSILIMFS